MSELRNGAKARRRRAVLAIVGVACVLTLLNALKPLHIDLYLFPDLETKETLTGVPDPVHSLGRL